MATYSKSIWIDGVDDTNEEQLNPVPPHTKYMAVRDFPGETPHDLPFCVGDIITIIEPCNVVFWYLGENSTGTRGVVPINFLKPCEPQKPLSVNKPVKSDVSKKYPLKMDNDIQSGKSNISAPPTRPQRGNFSSSLNPPVQQLESAHASVQDQIQAYTDIDNRPPAPLPPEATSSEQDSPKLQSKYNSQVEFMRKSGWFSPNLGTVLCRKMGNAQLSVIANSPGVYYFVHRKRPESGYTGKSKNAFHELELMFNQLFEKPQTKLSPLEFELRYNEPDAKDWIIRLLTVSSQESLATHEIWSIVNHRSLAPEGLNHKLTFESKEQFYEFAEKYAKKIRDKQNK